jgi:hypothetical protein
MVWMIPGFFALPGRFFAPPFHRAVHYTVESGAARDWGMASSVPEFWHLVEQSRLLVGEQCRQLHREFQATNGSTDHASPRALAEWLARCLAQVPDRASRTGRWLMDRRGGGSTNCLLAK